MRGVKFNDFIEWKSVTRDNVLLIKCLNSNLNKIFNRILLG